MTRNTLIWLALFGTVALVSPGLASAADPAMKKDGMLVNPKGMTLYTFGKDAEGKSMCNDKCAQKWPPLAAKATDTAGPEWTMVKRDDGSMQWAYEGQPVYTYVEDKKAGDMKGDNVGEWKAVMEDAD